MRTRRSGSLPLSDPQQPTPSSTTNGHRPPTFQAARDPSTTNGSPDETNLRTDAAGGSAAEEKGRGRRGGRVRRSSPPSAPTRVDKRKGKAAAGSSPPFLVPLPSQPWDRELNPPSSSQFRILVEVRIRSGSRSRCRPTHHTRARRHQPKTKLATLSLPRIHKVSSLSHSLLRSLTADSFLDCVRTAEGEIAGVQDGELCARNLIARRQAIEAASFLQNIDSPTKNPLLSAGFIVELSKTLPSRVKATLLRRNRPTDSPCLPPSPTRISLLQNRTEHPRLLTRLRFLLALKKITLLRRLSTPLETLGRSTTSTRHLIPTTTAVQGLGQVPYSADF